MPIPQEQVFCLRHNGVEDQDEWLTFDALMSLEHGPTLLRDYQVSRGMSLHRLFRHVGIPMPPLCLRRS